MLLIVRQRKSFCIFRVSKYIEKEKGSFVYCKGWPGEHELGKDCDLIRLREKEEPLVNFILDHTHLTVEAIARECKVEYYVVYRLITYLKIVVKGGGEKRKRQLKRKEGPFFDPSFSCF